MKEVVCKYCFLSSLFLGVVLCLDFTISNCQLTKGLNSDYSNEVKNDTIRYAYTIKYKSQNTRVVKIEKENLLKGDTLITYGKFNSTGQLKRSIIVDEISYYPIDSVFDWWLIDRRKRAKWVRDSVYLSHPTGPHFFIPLYPGQSYKYNLIFKGDIPTDKFEVWDRYIVLNDIEYSTRGIKRISYNSIPDSTNIIKIPIYPKR